MPRHTIITKGSARRAELALVAGIALLGMACSSDEPDATMLCSPADQLDWAEVWHAPKQYRGKFARAQFLMLKLASAAYGDDDNFTSEIGADGFVVKRSAHDGALDAYAGENEAGTMNFIALRGTTASGDDILTDLYNIPTFTEASGERPVTLHRGFASSGSRAAVQLKPSVRESCPDREGMVSRPLWITGHSLGGVSALIAGYLLAQEGCWVAGVSVFGTPRPGLTDFRDAYDETLVHAVSLTERSQRFVTAQDPVYCLPPGVAWAHVGIENRIADGVHLAASLGSQCESPQAWIGQLRAGLSDVSESEVEPRFQKAVLDFLAGGIELNVECEEGFGWDDLTGFGKCAWIDLSNRLLAFYNVTPAELLAELMRLAYMDQHRIATYRAALRVELGLERCDPGNSQN